MRRKLGITVLGVLLGITIAGVARADDDEKDDKNGRTILAFSTMYGVDGPFLNSTQVRGVLGDEAPWVVGRVSGFLKKDGHLDIQVKGLVFKNDPTLVPPDKIGINDEPTFRGLVSCLIEAGPHQVGIVNLTTGEFPATPTGNSHIDAQLHLPDQCIAPIVFVLAGSEDKWFSVTGVELK